jgi:hypothetical protein
MKMDHQMDNVENMSSLAEALQAVVADAFEDSQDISFVLSSASFIQDTTSTTTESPPPPPPQRRLESHGSKEIETLQPFHDAHHFLRALQGDKGDDTGDEGDASAEDDKGDDKGDASAEESITTTETTTNTSTTTTTVTTVTTSTTTITTATTNTTTTSGTTSTTICSSPLLTLLEGWLRITVPDPSEFAEDDDAQMAVKTGLALYFRANPDNVAFTSVDWSGGRRLGRHGANSLGDGRRLAEAVIISFTMDGDPVCVMQDIDTNHELLLGLNASIQSAVIAQKGTDYSVSFDPNDQYLYIKPPVYTTTTTRTTVPMSTTITSTTSPLPPMIGSVEFTYTLVLTDPAATNLDAYEAVSILEQHPSWSIRNSLMSRLSIGFNILDDAATVLSNEAVAGTRQVEIVSSAGFLPGRSVLIGAATENEEVKTIESVEASHLVLSENLTYSHAVGTTGKIVMLELRRRLTYQPFYKITRTPYFFQSVVVMNDKGVYLGPDNANEYLELPGAPSPPPEERGEIMFLVSSIGGGVLLLLCCCGIVCSIFRIPSRIAAQAGTKGEDLNAMAEQFAADFPGKVAWFIENLPGMLLRLREWLLQKLRRITQRCWAFWEPFLSKNYGALY